MTRAVYFGLDKRNWRDNGFQHPSLSFDELCNLEIHFNSGRVFI